MKYNISDQMFWSSMFVCLITLTACKSESKLKIFSPELELLISSFTEKQTIIFSSGELTDTIIFYPAKDRFEKIRHLERGFYNMYSRTVEYELTSGSYHKGMQGPKIFLSMVNYSNITGSELWLHFLELSFDEDAIIPKLSPGSVTFDRSFARHKYTEAPKEHCIQEFNFENSIGVTEFTDCLGKKFIRN